MKDTNTYLTRAHACLEAAHAFAIQPRLTEQDSVAMAAMATLASANMQAAELRRAEAERISA